MESGFNIVSFAPFILIFALMYFLIIRPQNKKAKEHQAMVHNLGKGDRVVMNGGLMGTISKVVSDTELELSLETGTARVARSMVASVIPAATPAKASAAKSAGKSVAKKAAAKKVAPKKAPAKKKTVKK